MKIFYTDNFNRETVNEYEVVSGLTDEQAKAVLNELHKHCSSNGSTWYRIAAENDKPYTWEP